MSIDLVNHWSDMPEWGNGRRLWAVYFTFPGEQALHRAVRGYQDAIADVPGLDLIDLDWLHLTMQGIAFVDEVELPEVKEISRQLSRLTTGTARPTTFSTRPPILDHDSIGLPVVPTDELNALRADLVAAIGKVLVDRQPYRLPEPVGGFRPHISIAYANIDQPGAEILDRLSAVVQEPVELELTHLSFLLLRRSRPRWLWDAEYRMSLREPDDDGFAA